MLYFKGFSCSLQVRGFKFALLICTDATLDNYLWLSYRQHCASTIQHLRVMSYLWSHPWSSIISNHNFFAICCINDHSLNTTQVAAVACIFTPTSQPAPRVVRSSCYDCCWKVKSFLDSKAVSTYHGWNCRKWGNSCSNNLAHDKEQIMSCRFTWILVTKLSQYKEYKYRQTWDNSLHQVLHAL